MRVAALPARDCDYSTHHPKEAKSIIAEPPGNFKEVFMEDKVIPLNSVRPEKWTISVGRKCDNFICCYFTENHQCWTGLVEVSSIDRLPEVLNTAQAVMISAKAQNRRVEVTV